MAGTWGQETRCLSAPLLLLLVPATDLTLLSSAIAALVCP